MDWTNPDDIRFSLQQLVKAGLNTVKLSYFGHTAESDLYAPTWLFSKKIWPHEGRLGTYTEAE
ncbi:hypothetical protein [Kibdelosporangium philippinense]|uniref:hypothetical protein n=1 Tax=Kibdelosporangium philippinense TaxID=211113 RepID=UPI003613487B